MGKKVNQASVKISKDEKQNFNSLIKALRPKVYITDSSSFKKLVQELTGNGNSTTLSPPPLEPILVDIENENENFPIIENTSVDVSANSSEATSNSSELSCSALMNEEFNQVCNQLCLDDSVFQDSMANQTIDQFLAFQNLETQLFDVDANPFYNCYEQFELPDVSIYDYELSGLL